MHFNSDDISSEKVWRTSGEYPMKYVRGKSKEVLVEYNFKSKNFRMIIIGHRINLFNEEWWLNGRNDGNDGIWFEQRTSLRMTAQGPFTGMNNDTHLKNNVHIRDTWRQGWKQTNDGMEYSHMEQQLHIDRTIWNTLKSVSTCQQQSDVRRSLTESAHAESEDTQVLTPGKESYFKKMNLKKMRRIN